MEMVYQMLILMNWLNFTNEKAIATMTAVNPPGRFGAIDIDNDLVTSFKESLVERRAY